MQLIRDPNSNISSIYKSMIKTSKIESDMKNPIPKMTTVNIVLKNETLQYAIWNYFGWDRSECPMPVFPNDFLFGVISNIVHNPDLKFIFMSNLVEKKYKCFFTNIAENANRVVDTYDEVLASAYED